MIRVSFRVAASCDAGRCANAHLFRGVYSSRTYTSTRYPSRAKLWIIGGQWPFFKVACAALH